VIISLKKLGEHFNTIKDQNAALYRVMHVWERIYCMQRWWWHQVCLGM